jgi:hypothetical protein
MLDSFNATLMYHGTYYANFFLELIAQYQELYHIFVASMQAAMSPQTFIQWTDMEGRHILAHKTKGISLLRKRLLQPDATADDGAVLSMVYLSHFEARNENLAASNMHREHATQLIKARGGIESLEASSGVKQVAIL